MDSGSPGLDAPVWLYNGFPSFRLAVFAMLSGLFVSRSVQRRGIGRYVLSRDTLFVYLYVVWTLLQGLVKVVAGAAINSPVSLSDLPLKLVYPDAQLWFFGFLVVMTTVVVPIQPWKSRWRAAWLVLVTAFGLIMWFTGWPNSDVIGLKSLALVLFYVAGFALGAKRVVDFERNRPTWALAVTAVGSSCLFAWVTAIQSPESPAASTGAPGLIAPSLGMVAAISGALAVLAWSAMIGRLPSGIARPIAFTGRHSLEVFVAHLTFTSGTRIILEKLGIDSLAVHIPCGILVGTVGPLVLAILTPRLRLSWLWEPPAFIRRRVGLSPAPQSVGSQQSPIDRTRQDANHAVVTRHRTRAQARLRVRQP
jgi:hypothetical protein